MSDNQDRCARTFFEVKLHYELSTPAITLYVSGVLLREIFLSGHNCAALPSVQGCTSEPNSNLLSVSAEYIQNTKKNGCDNVHKLVNSII